ncbi:fasciclin domain-containing protein 3 [Paramyrothecium foliicola]|nr:fasciclin domain-containing protein 3 [Paramyrothecium foliicola]
MVERALQFLLRVSIVLAEPSIQLNIHNLQIQSYSRTMFRSLQLLGFALVGVSHAQSGLSDLISSQSDLSRLGELLAQVPELAQSLASASNVTILAPVNSAFDRLNGTQGSLSSDVIQALLAYHVINGTYTSENITDVPTFVPTLLTDNFTVGNQAQTNVTAGQNLGLLRDSDNDDDQGDVVVVSGELQTATVVEADISQGGFTVHKIDRILTIPLNFSRTATALGLSAGVGALEATDLLDTVDTLQDVTIFLPENEAFQAVGSAFANASTETLQSVLQYHAVAGSVVFSTQVTNTSVETVQGNQLNLTVIDGTVFVNSAKVVLPNVILSNGVLHVIDGVLNPDGSSNPDDLDPESTPSAAFSGASSVQDVPFTSAAPTASSTISVPDVLTDAPAVPTGGAGGNGGSGDGGDNAPEGAGHALTPYGLLQVGALVAGAVLLM